ncbi:MAG TPA: NADH dehydrogenase subunit E, partial [Beijerinckiaceae bacterium]|nr:NADH dehydrogenase subunit E [Beijerinckiaceae bacterium]
VAVAAPVAAPAKPAAAKAPAEKKASDADKPPVLTAARGGKADDLKLIWGVGPKLEKMLHGMGIFHFDQIAAWTDKQLAWVDENLEGFYGRAERDKWIEQSKKLATGWRPENSVGDKPAGTK